MLNLYFVFAADQPHLLKHGVKAFLFSDNKLTLALVNLSNCEQFAHIMSEYIDGNVGDIIKSKYVTLKVNN